MFKVIVLSSLIIFIFSTEGFAESSEFSWQELFDSSYYSKYKNKPSLKSYWFKLSKSSNVVDFQDLSFGIDALTAMYVSTNESKYLNDALKLVDNVTSSARVSNQIHGNKYYLKDEYLSWINADTLRKTESTFMIETHLSEAYFFRYVSRLLRIIKLNNDAMSNYEVENFYRKNLAFIEKHVWEKWYNRGKRNNMCDQFLKSGRTHIASHWAFIAINLEELTLNQEKRMQYNEVYEWYNAKLRENLIPHPRVKRTWSWNSTWDKGWNILGLNCDKLYEYSEVQDVSHGNQVISYIIEAYKLNKGWNKTDIKKLNRLLHKCIWIKGENTFRDTVLGERYKKGKSSPGVFQAEGFVKLSEFSFKTYRLYLDFVKYNIDHIYSNQHAQLFANLSLSNKKVFHKLLLN